MTAALGTELIVKERNLSADVGAPYRHNLSPMEQVTYQFLKRQCVNKLSDFLFVNCERFTFFDNIWDLIPCS